MQIYPAIDIRGGQCVRLRQGDYNQETVFGSDPASMARRWQDEGAAFLHLVDLDGAKDGRPINGKSVESIVKNVTIPCQLGGGIRTDDDIQRALAWGVQRVIVGTKAIEDPGWLERMCTKQPQKIVLGIDAKNGMVATDGWLDVSKTSSLELARRFEDLLLAAIVYTDISKDGMMQGPNIEAMREMANAVKLPVIASGGVSKPSDVTELRKTGVAGCIIGRALYEGSINLSQII